ncbi:hypothetical protein KI387_024351, partial [Taxus chinensis]
MERKRLEREVRNNRLNERKEKLTKNQHLEQDNVPTSSGDQLMVVVERDKVSEIHEIIPALSRDKKSVVTLWIEITTRKCLVD